MDKTIKYKETDILFKNLYESGHNMDSFIIDDSLFSRKDHQYELFYKYLKPGSIVWDIGAYIGTFAIPFSISGYKVYAFEGFPSNFNRLVENCKPYDIECHLCALSDEDKPTHSLFADCQDQSDPEKQEIKYVMFDDYVSKHNIPNPKFVKLDIEGMESIALLKMTNILENIRPIWQIGYHHPGDIKESIDGYPGFRTTDKGGFDFTTFEKLDYVIYNLKTMQPSKFLWGDCNGEYLCIPKEKIKNK